MPFQGCRSRSFQSGRASANNNDFLLSCRWNYDFVITFLSHIWIYSASYCRSRSVPRNYAFRTSNTFSNAFFFSVHRLYRPIWIGNKCSSQSNDVCRTVFKQFLCNFWFSYHSNGYNWYFHAIVFQNFCEVRSPGLWISHWFQSFFFISKPNIRV